MQRTKLLPTSFLVYIVYWVKNAMKLLWFSTRSEKAREIKPSVTKHQKAAAETDKETDFASASTTSLKVKQDEPVKASKSVTLFTFVLPLMAAVIGRMWQNLLVSWLLKSRIYSTCLCFCEPRVTRLPIGFVFTCFRRWEYLTQVYTGWMFYTGQMSRLSPNQQCQSTERNIEHWPLPTVWNWQKTFPASDFLKTLLDNSPFCTF